MSLLWIVAPVRAEQHALLIGVSDYADKRIPDLEGPRHDVTSLQKLLVNHWGFDPQRVNTLIDKAATEEGILSALNKLRLQTAPGDDILIYFSGHGTSAQDPDLGAKLHLPDGSGALATHDLNPESLTRLAATQSVPDGLLVGRYELKPVFTALNQDRRVLIIFDTCFSGNTARAVVSDYEPPTKRYLPLDLSALADATPTRSAAIKSDDADYSFDYRSLVYFGAAAEDELAIDYSQAEIDAGLITTFDGKPHGGFTNALLHALAEDPPNQESLSFSQLFSSLQQQFSLRCKACGHNPVSLPAIERDPNNILAQSFLHRASVPGVLRPPAISDSTPQSHATLTVALSSNRALPASLSTQLPPRAQAGTPDILLHTTDDAVQALAANGQLITTFAPTVAPARFEQWLASREWLKHRSQLDQQHGTRGLHAQFRHPLQGTRVRDGESLFFTVQADTKAHLGILIMTSTGDLSVLYPSNETELQSVLKAHSPVRIPAISQPQLRVTQPWGTDTVLFYALPAKSDLIDFLYSMAQDVTIALSDPRLQAFERALDSGKVPYSVSVTTILSTE